MIGSIIALDTALVQALYALRDPSLVAASIWAREFASVFTIGALAVALGLYLLSRARLADFAGLCISLLGTIAAVILLKELVARARPDLLYRAYLESGFSFPSGHAARALVLYGFAIYLVRARSSRRVAIAATVALSLLIGLAGASSLYLGLHYFSDVLIGYAVAAIFLALGIWATKRIARHPLYPRVSAHLKALIAILNDPF